MIMSDEILEEFTKQYITSQKVSEITFGWQGGEPMLMGLDFYKKALEFQRKYTKPGVGVINTLQTNGILLNDRWGKFLRDNNFLVGLSIDGPPKIHNSFRVDQKGNPTSEHVVRGIEILKKYQIDFNILCCVHSLNSLYPQEVYRYLRDELEVRYIQFIPIIEKSTQLVVSETGTCTSYSVTGDQYGKFLISIFDEWIRKDVGKVFIQLFDICLGTWLNIPSSLCVFAPICGRALVLEHNGDLYSCDHFVFPKHFLGNILNVSLLELVNSRQQIVFGQNKHNKLPKSCLTCEYLFACNGGCPKNRLIKTKDELKRLNYLCSGYKSFFQYIDPYMREMAQFLREGREASNIMKKFK